DMVPERTASSMRRRLRSAIRSPATPSTATFQAAGKRLAWEPAFSRLFGGRYATRQGKPRSGGRTMTANSARSIVADLTLMSITCDAVGQERAFDFALIGDMPYTRVQEIEYQRVLAALNAADLAFVAHIGDFQFDATPYNRNPAIASMPCVDENYKAIYDSFQTIRHPFILTPGDNDWSDCWPLQAQKVD